MISLIIISKSMNLNESSSYTGKILVNGEVKPTPDGVLLSVLEEFSIPDNVIFNHTFESIHISFMK